MTQEALAGLGIAVAVALIFAALVANGSIAGSAGQAIQAMSGSANLQLEARDSEGFDEALLAKVQRLPGVERATPLLEQNASICRPRARCVAVNLTGTDASLAVFDELVQTLPLFIRQPGGVALTTTTAERLDIGAGARNVPVSVSLRGRTASLKVVARLGPEAVGALSQTFIATLPLSSLQKLAGLPGRISRILIQTKPSREVTVGTALQALTKGRLSVEPADHDLALLRQALRPGDQAGDFFALIAGLLGFMYAMLLTVPERRQTIVELRLAGTRTTAIVEIVLFQALCLGACASLLGLLAGYILSIGAFHQSAGYLTQAFTLSRGTVVGSSPMLVSFLVGIGVAWLASMIPLLDMRRGRALDALYLDEGAPGHDLGQRPRHDLAWAAFGLLACTAAVFILTPSLALVACILLALTVACAIPQVFISMLRAAEAFVRRSNRLLSLPVAIMSLKATTLRSFALAATGAVALYGSIALGGARADLLRGIEGYIHNYVADADIWVVNRADPTAVEPLPRSYLDRIERLSGVVKVDIFQNSYLNIGERRVWVLARPPETSATILRNQIVKGSATAAASRIDHGWITMSAQLADERNVKIGGTVTLPTPTGRVAFKVAALTTNLTWSPGSILMSDKDYSRAWGTSAPTALGIDLGPGVNVEAALHAIRHLLGPANGAEVLTPAVRASHTTAVGREGLSKLDDISTLLTSAAIVAFAAMLISMFWQRRPSLASLRLSGAPIIRLWRILMIEALLILTTACTIGAVAGPYGQAAIDRYLRHVTGFPVANATLGGRPLGLFATVIAAVLMIAFIPGWLALRVPVNLALEDE